MSDPKIHLPETRIVGRLEDIPEFASDEERTRFWDGHALSEALWVRLRQGDPELEQRLSSAEEAETEPGSAIEFLGSGRTQTGSAN